MQLLPWKEVMYGRKLSAGKKIFWDARFSQLIVIITILVIIIILGIIIMITWDDEDVSILVSVVGTMPGCAVADGEPGSLVADQLQRYLVFGIQYLVFSICKERPTAKKETWKQKWGKPRQNTKEIIHASGVALLLL